MNETLSKLRKLAKKSDKAYIHGERDPMAGPFSDRWVFVVTFQKGGEILGKVPVWGEVRNGNDDTVEQIEAKGGSYPEYSGQYSPKHGFWSLWNPATLRSALRAMPANGEPEFFVYLDSYTTPHHTRCLLHSDALYLRSGTDRVLLDVATGPHNTARFGSPGVTAPPPGYLTSEIAPVFFEKQFRLTWR